MRDAKNGQQQLSATVAAHLREQIISGALSQGEFLRIDAIAKTLGVSTTPVREGLLILQSESLVQLIPRRGFMVTGLDEAQVLDIFWAQATVGAELAARATAHISEAELDQLDALNVQYLALAAAQDAPALVQLGYQFHKTINLAAGSPRLASLMGSLTKQLSNTFYTDIEGQVQDSVHYHPLLAQAMRLRNAPAVRAMMFQHIYNGGPHLIAMLQRQKQARAAAGAPPAPAARTPRVRSAAR